MKLGLIYNTTYNNNKARSTFFISLLRYSLNEGSAKQISMATKKIQHSILETQLTQNLNLGLTLMKPLMSLERKDREPLAADGAWVVV